MTRGAFWDAPLLFVRRQEFDSVGFMYALALGWRGDRCIAGERQGYAGACVDLRFTCVSYEGSFSGLRVFRHIGSGLCRLVSIFVLCGGIVADWRSGWEGGCVDITR